MKLNLKNGRGREEIVEARTNQKKIENVIVKNSSDVMMKTENSSLVSSISDNEELDYRCLLIHKIYFALITSILKGKGWPSAQSGSTLTTPASYHAGKSINVTYGGEVTGVRRGAGGYGPPKASGWAPEPPSRVYQMPSAPMSRSNVGVYQMPEYRQPDYRWAGAPGATSWQSQSKPVLYPPPNWCKEEVKTMILPMKLEMSALFDQPWFLEMTGDAQHSAWYAKVAILMSFCYLK